MTAPWMPGSLHGAGERPEAADRDDSSPISTKQSVAAAEPLLAMRGIDKGFAGIAALTGASLEVCAGRGARAHRPERRRQVDADQGAHRLL